MGILTVTKSRGHIKSKLKCNFSFPLPDLKLRGLWTSFFAVSLVMGIPTVKREKQHYLINTLHSLLYELSEEQKNDCVIIIFVGEVSLHGKVQYADRKTIWRFMS